jgi:hypothetical protein
MGVDVYKENPASPDISKDLEDFMKGFQNHTLRTK